LQAVSMHSSSVAGTRARAAAARHMKIFFSPLAARCLCRETCLYNAVQGRHGLEREVSVMCRQPACAARAAQRWRWREAPRLLAAPHTL